jgi:hypothetical protein
VIPRSLKSKKGNTGDFYIVLASHALLCGSETWDYKKEGSRTQSAKMKL